jgi:hypothetical protein
VEISFTPSDDVVTILNVLLDKFENRAKRKRVDWRSRVETEAEGTYSASRSVQIILDDMDLPSYFSQIDPQSRIIANQQLQYLEQQGLLQLKWLPGETNHLLHSIALRTELHPQRSVAGSTQYDVLYKLIQRTPISDQRTRLESLLLAEKFRYQKDDWRAHALDHILQQLHTGKSPSPFSLVDSNLNLDLLAILQALPTLTTETPYRVFSVRIFNDSKRFEDLKPSLIRLARRANPEWKSFTSEDLLHELNLVANPGYIHLAGNWELTDINGQLINLDCFTPSIGFPAAQITSLQKITIRAESVLCIENLTSFHEFLYSHAIRSTPHATLCLMGNPSPSIRHLLGLIPADIPIYLWADMDYGGFNILSQLRRLVSPSIQPYLMDIATFDQYAQISRPFTRADARNLQRLLFDSVLRDVNPIIKHLLKQGLKLEQEAIRI